MSSLVVPRQVVAQAAALGRLLCRRRFALAVILPALLLLAGTLLFRATDTDLAIVGLFYDDVQRAWPFVEAEPWNTLYLYGPLPGLLIGIGGGLLGIGATAIGKWETWGKAGVFLALMLLLGPGLAVNTIFKPHWGRPRPNQVDQFGGDYAFLKVGQPGWNDQLKSFPSGHASMGFYLFAPAFLFFRRQPRLALVFLLLGLAAGGALGVTRVVQGRHFPSDVLWSAGMVYYSGLLAYLLLGLWRMGDLWRIGPEPAAASAAASPEIFSIEQARREREQEREETQEADRRKTA